METLLRGLLSANGLRDANVRVVEGIRALLGATAVALYEEVAGVWVCRTAAGPGPRVGDALRDQPMLGAANSIATDPLPGTAEILPADGVLSAEDARNAALVLCLRAAAHRMSLLLIGPPLDGRAYGGDDLKMLARVSPDLEQALRKADDLDTLRSQAFVDALTGSYNRRGFDEHLHVELLRAKRYERPLALMLVDLDAFKSINDELGHQAGDHVLRRFAALLANTFRTTDIISRYGGDEFGVIFPETTRSEAAHLAERLRLLVSGLFPDAQISRQITASFGVAAFPPDGDDATALVAGADRALYAAKSRGRDRVVAADQLGPPRR